MNAPGAFYQRTYCVVLSGFIFLKRFTLFAYMKGGDESMATKKKAPAKKAKKTTKKK